MTYDQWKTDSGYSEPNEPQVPLTAPEPKIVECPNCHDANKYGDYEGPTCEVCSGVGSVAIVP